MTENTHDPVALEEAMIALVFLRGLGARSFPATVCRTGLMPAAGPWALPFPGDGCGN